MSDAEISVPPLVDNDDDVDDKSKGGKPNKNQIRWLQRGLDQAGGKLPLFDKIGQKVSDQTVRSCIRNGWAEPWFNNPIKPDWLVCRLTDKGRQLASEAPLENDETIM